MTGAVRTTIVPFWVSGDDFRRCVGVGVGVGVGGWVGGKNGIVGSLQDGWLAWLCVCVCVVLCLGVLCSSRQSLQS